MLESSGKSPLNEADHDIDEALDGSQAKQLYERGWLPDAEEREGYRLGGFHPIHIGDTLGTAGRFRVIHKLGRGGLATVWLCRDQNTQKYVALKIIIADESRETSSELGLLNKGLDFGEAGGECIAVPREHFWHDGPNGRHLCLVLPVLGPRVSALWRKFEDPARVSRDIALQATRGLLFLHKNGICHGDFHPSNILLRLTGFDELGEDELIEKLGEPRKEPLLTISGGSPAPSGPEYLVEGLDLERLDARFISDQVSIIDFGESYDMHHPPQNLGIPSSFRSPELFFDNTIGVGCDLWALACTIFEIRTRSPLFENPFNEDDEVIMQMVPMLGMLPEPWWSSWEARGQWYNEDGTPLVNPETGKPYMMTDALEELMSASSVSAADPEGKKNRTGGLAVQIEERKLLGNLLRGILEYEPKERLSVEAALKHSWFKI